MRFPLQAEAVPFDLEEIYAGIPERFRRIVKAFPNKLAVKSPGIEFTYSDLDRRAAHLARELLTQAGSLPEPVALLLAQDANMLAAILGILYAGKFYCVLNPTDPDPRLGEILADLGPKVLLTDARNLDRARRLASAGCRLLELEQVGTEAQDAPPGSILTPDALAGIFYTSGSTGTAKGVPRTCELVLHRAWADIHDLEILPQDRLMLLRTCAFSGSLVDIFDALLAGAYLYIFDPGSQNPSLVSRTIQEEGITIFHPPIELLRYLLRTCPQGTSFPSVRYLILSGDVLYRKDVETARPFFNKQLFILHHLSSSETGLLTRFQIRADTELSQDIVPVGFPVSGKEILILADDGSLVQDGEIGEIAVRTRFRFAPYWGQPERSAEKYTADPQKPGQQLYRTGDLGRIDSAGRLEFLGRKDFQVKIRGYRVNLSVVEACLNSIQGVDRAIVAMRQDGSGAKRMAAYLTTHPKARITTRQLLANMAKRLPSYMLPSAFVFLEKFPLTPSGKVDRPSLPDPEWEHRERDEKYRPPRSEAERRLVELWQDSLGVHRVGIRDDFFSLGGDSLAAAEILTGIEQSYGISLPLATFLEHRTVEHLAARLRRESEGKPVRSLVAVQPLGSRPPLFLLPGHLGDTLYFRFLARQLGQDQPVYGVELLSAGGASIAAIDLAKTARYCLEEIRSLQATGPYHLAGHSFGGLLAFEIAQQLTTAGERVAFLGMFDTRAPGTRIRATLPERAAIHYRNLRGAPSLEQQDYLRERARSILIRLAENDLLRRLLSALHVLPQDASALNRIASRIYAPRRYPGKVTLFRSQERSWYVHQDPTAGWQAYAAGLEIHEVPGDHASMLRDPHVSMLAQALKGCLAAADSLSPDTPRGVPGEVIRMNTDPAPGVSHDPLAMRFALELEGHLAVLEYQLADGKILFTHTHVPNELGGRGIGSQLARAGLEHAQAQGLRVVPLCSFIAGYIQKHPEYQALVE